MTKHRREQVAPFGFQLSTLLAVVVFFGLAAAMLASMVVPGPLEIENVQYLKGD